MSKRKVERFSIVRYSTHLGLGVSSAMAEQVIKREIVYQPSSHHSFFKVSSQFKTELDNFFKKNKEIKEGEELTDLETQAILGRPEAVTTLLEKIETFLQENKIQPNQVELPVYYRDLNLTSNEEQRKYSNLAHAIFHEEYGWNALAYWLTVPNSYAMQTVGTYIWVFDPNPGVRRFVLMPFQLKSGKVVEKIIRLLVRHKENAKITEGEPVLELDLYTGERVQIAVEPRMRRKVITFRRVLPQYITLQQHRDSGMFPHEAYPLMQSITLCMANTIISGEMGSGKTSLLRAMIHERPDHIGGFSIEDDYEIHISTVNPKKKFIEFILRGSSFEETIKAALRTDAEYGVIQEVRVDEAEGAMIVCERLKKGFISTTHIWRTETIPEQWGRLISNKNGGQLELEQRRVAEYIDLIILLGFDNETRKTRLLSLEELRYNRQNKEISTHKLMRLNPDTGNYEYRFDVSKQLLAEMKAKSLQWYNTFVKTLKMLEAQNPIPEGEGVTIFNPAIADPQYRQALAAEHLAQEQRRVGDLLEQLLATMGRGG